MTYKHPVRGFRWRSSERLTKTTAARFSQTSKLEDLILYQITSTELFKTMPGSYIFVTKTNYSGIISLKIRTLYRIRKLRNPTSGKL